ncbi:hypothetical protein [Christiangramia sp. SM2212]|nr:hypothetical protein [Christiangramia sp. SM2212]
MKVFVFYLCFIFVVDTIGLYPIWAFFDKYETLPFLKDSPFHRNFWLYNIVRVINYLVFGYVFSSQIHSLKKYHLKKILHAALILFGIYSLICYSTFGNFLYAEEFSVIFIGTIIVFFCLIAYFFEVLLSDKILSLTSDALFYSGTGVLLWQLCVVPLKIYTSYFNTSNPEFIKMYGTALMYANIFLYSMFIIGFYVEMSSRLKAKTA